MITTLILNQMLQMTKNKSTNFRYLSHSAFSEIMSLYRFEGRAWYLDPCLLRLSFVDVRHFLLLSSGQAVMFLHQGLSSDLGFLA